MSTTPIPSSSAEDFKLNAEDFDAFANGTGSYTDRFGNSRLSLSQFMESIGYEAPVAFTTGLSITRITQTVTESGNTYHARADAIPFTTTGVFNAAQWDLIVSNPVEVSTHAATSKTTPVDADELPLVDSEASFGLKKLTWSNLKATLKTYFDTLYHPIGSYLSTTGGTMTGLLKFAAGSNIASAATVNLSTATGNTVHITGTTGISAWTMTPGQVMDVIFDDALTLTHNATTNNLPSGADVTTAVGDRARFYYDGTTVYCISYTKADGTALVAPVSYAPGQQEFLTSGTFTVPDGVTSVYLSGIAGGGGGGSATSTTGSGGSSGAPGQQCLRQRVAVTPGSNISVTIGAGGSAVSDGGKTQFGANSLPGGAAGASGTGSIAYTPAGCGPATGTSTATVIGGAGHDTIWGLGGRGGSGSNGLAAQANSGAGGGGASNNGSNSRTGGAGGSGYLLVEW